MKISSQMNALQTSAVHSSPHNDVKTIGASRPSGMERYWGHPSSQPEEGTYGMGTYDPNDPIDDQSHQVPPPFDPQGRPAQVNANGQLLDPFGNPMDGRPGSYGAGGPPQIAGHTYPPSNGQG
ncbi:MAG TPA: hypothetical protein VGL08_05100 [Paraburkholderia sp.]|jgi:hypothetical protein